MFNCRKGRSRLANVSRAVSATGLLLFGHAAFGQNGVGVGAPSAGAPAAGTAAPGDGTVGTSATSTGATPGAAGNMPVSSPPAEGNVSGQSAGPGAIPSVTGSVVVGQPSAGWDLPKTIAAALRSSSDLMNIERTAEIDRKRADQAEAAARPNASASASATRFDQATVIPFGATKIEVQKDNTQTLAINLADNLDLFGTIRAQRNQFRLQSDSDQYQAIQIRDARILRAQTTYYNLLRARHQYDVAQASLREAEAQQSTAANLNAEGVGQKIDLLRANTQLATAQQTLSQALNSADIAQANFNDLVGQDLQTPVYLSDIPGATVGVTPINTDTVGSPTSSVALFSPPVDALSSIDMTRSLQTAYSTRPEILEAQTLVDADKLGIKIAHAGLQPQFQLTAGADYFPTTSFQTPRQRTAEVTATLVVPLYDGGATNDRVAEAKLTTQNAQTSLDSARTDVALDVRQAYLNLVTADEQIASANAALQQAIAARQLAEIRYEGQVGLYLEVTDAEAALVTAQNSQVNAVYDYEIARAQFLNALGTPATD